MKDASATNAKTPSPVPVPQVQRPVGANVNVIKTEGKQTEEGNPKDPVPADGGVGHSEFQTPRSNGVSLFLC